MALESSNARRDPAIGCVLAVQDRPPDTLERALQTYEFQLVKPDDRVLVDFGSQPNLSSVYKSLGERYRWRVVTVAPVGRRWSLSEAYNIAVSQLAPCVEVVFKSDVDVLLGADVLAKARNIARERLCLFDCLTTVEGVAIPDRIDCDGDLVSLLETDPPPVPYEGEGIHAFPRAWFESIGGFDLAYSGWGFEDSDLRLRASWSIGVHRESSSLLLHQCHRRSFDAEQARQNRLYYQSTKSARVLVRNGGVLVSPNNTVPTSDAHSERVVIVTRSLSASLFRLSDNFLDFRNCQPAELRPTCRYRCRGMDATSYLRELRGIDAEWIVNLDEDVFLIDPQGVISLIVKMARDGYAACGMPDGGVVPIRRHNPLVCNTFFNIFNGPTIRRVWSDWEQVVLTQPSDVDSYELPAFSQRTESAFDQFEPYYPAFFALRACGERILMLDAEPWKDGVSTILKTLDGSPLLIHCWYARMWERDKATQFRYSHARDFAWSTGRHRSLSKTLDQK